MNILLIPEAVLLATLATLVVILSVDWWVTHK